MSALLSPVQEGEIWRVQIVWPDRHVNYFGKFTSERDAIDWINAHPNLTEPQIDFSLIGQCHCVEVAARSLRHILIGDAL